MGRLLLALLAAALVVAGPAQAKGPHAILMPGNDPPEAGGRPWEVTVELMEFGREANVALLARQGNREAVASLRTAPSEFQEVRRYTAQLVFPSEGRWELLALSGKRRFDFAPIDVGSGRVPRDYVAFAVGSRAEREGAGGVYLQSGDTAPGSGGQPLPPEEFTVAADDGDGGGPPFWIIPLAGVVLAGAGVLKLRSR